MLAQVLMDVSDDAVPIDQPFELALECIKVHQERHAISDGSCAFPETNTV